MALDAHDLDFLVLSEFIDACNVGIGKLLHVIQAAAFLVLGDQFVFERLFQKIVRVMSNVANRNTMVFCDLVHLLCELFAALLIERRYREANEAVYGRLNIETVNLDGVNPLFGGLITPLVQSTINTRVNPIQIIHPGQLAVDVPVASTGGKLQVMVEDVRAEVKDNALNLHVYYSFSGSPGL